MTTQIGTLYKKRVVKNLSGQIIDLVDETDGGWIIRGGRIINQEKYAELQKREEDKREAAKAMTQAIAAAPEVEAMRQGTAVQATASLERMEKLEKRIEEQDNKLDAILAALKK